REQRERGLPAPGGRQDPGAPGRERGGLRRVRPRLRPVRPHPPPDLRGVRELLLSAGLMAPAEPRRSAGAPGAPPECNAGKEEPDMSESYTFTVNGVSRTTHKE